MNGVRHRPHRESIAGRFDADANALQELLAGGVARQSHAHRIDVDGRPASDGRIRLRVRPRAASFSGPIGRPAPIDLPCQRHDPDLWFADAPADLERAKALCAGCPARLRCLTGAVDRREPAGVWGGQIFDDGRIVTHKRPRGRPRKNSIPPRSHRVLTADVSEPQSSRPGWLAVLVCRDSELDTADPADHRVGEDIDEIVAERVVAGYHRADCRT
jgi:WhiB family redox-sensing transcriptional regulator